MKSNRRFFTALFAFALLLTATLGCRQLQNLRGGSSDSDNVNSDLPEIAAQGDETKPTSAKSGLNEKSNLYIGKCFNAYSNRVMDSYSRYASWIRDMKVGPTGKESIVYGLYDVNGDGSDCASAVSEAGDIEPDMPETEEIAERYSAALTEVIAAIRGVYKYYDQEDYKDDNFQKGKESHTGLVAAFEKFKAVNNEFQAEIDNIENEVAQQQLEQYRNDPSKKFAFSVVDFNIKAKKVSGYVQRTEYSQMSADELQAMNDEIEAAITQMKSNAGNDPFASLYFSAADDFVKASKELMRRIRDKKPFDDFERRQLGTAAGWMVEGSPDKVINKYNDLIQRRSSLRL
jgi:hypothetical protein